ncbi:MAG: hypothetical protein IIW08_09240, partial [Clostridia bacterium]|nr:hypothetical protein [Clostridia bacterium]
VLGDYLAGLLDFRWFGCGNDRLDLDFCGHDLFGRLLGRLFCSRGFFSAHILNIGFSVSICNSRHAPYTFCYISVMKIIELFLNPHTSPAARGLEGEALNSLQKELELYVAEEQRNRPGYVPRPEDFHIMRERDGSFHVIDD